MGGRGLGGSRAPTAVSTGVMIPSRGMGISMELPLTKSLVVVLFFCLTAGASWLVTLSAINININGPMNLPHEIITLPATLALLLAGALISSAGRITPRVTGAVYGACGITILGATAILHLLAPPYDGAEAQSLGYPDNIHRAGTIGYNLAYSFGCLLLLTGAMLATRHWEGPRPWKVGLAEMGFVGAVWLTVVACSHLFTWDTRTDKYYTANLLPVVMLAALGMVGMGRWARLSRKRIIAMAAIAFLSIGILGGMNYYELIEQDNDGEAP